MMAKVVQARIPLKVGNNIHYFK